MFSMLNASESQTPAWLSGCAEVKPYVRDYRTRDKPLPDLFSIRKTPVSIPIPPTVLAFLSCMRDPESLPHACCCEGLLKLMLRPILLEVDAIDLLDAVRRGDVLDVQRVVVFAPHRIDAENWSALAISLVHGRVEVAQQLVAAGADLSKLSTEAKDLALRGAAKVGCLQAAEELLTLKADLEAVDVECGSSPLVLAARNGHELLVQMLIAAGADVDAEDRWGQTALGLAATFAEHQQTLEKRRAAAKSDVMTAPALKPITFAVLRDIGDSSVECGAIVEMLRASGAAR
eukprot:TRINITY_DN717_c0_g1_i2.p1 TRINITY_DN717_c0_g1~~TRINITY_DN717_c0_g1_i2.p1  ORF type:complete len:289 (-),score=65.69 TRINITY_DN717_c0_g1_i2:277-1143(-)